MDESPTACVTRGREMDGRRQLSFYERFERLAEFWRTAEISKNWRGDEAGPTVTSEEA